jgi:hypothetical protein
MPLAPFLLAIYPVLVEFSANAELLTAAALLRPFFVIVLVVGVLILALRFLGRDHETAGLYALMGIFLFWWWRTLLWVLGLVGLSGGLALALSPALAVAAIGGIRRWILGASRVRLREVYRVALVLAVLLVAQASWQVGKMLHWSPEVLPPVPVLKTVSPPAHRPDIYFLVLDAYIRDDFLRSRYGFDNRPFLRALEERGFFIAREARSNFAWTNLSVTATLNMSYLEGEGVTNQALLERARDPLVPRFLAHLGYRTRSVSCGNWIFDRTQFQESVGSHWQEFEGLLFGRSGVGELFPQIRDVARRHQLRVNLRAIAPRPVGSPPLFLFSHLLAPHPPFVFLADGSPTTSLPLFGIPDIGVAADRVMGPGWYRRRYLEQLQWINRSILERIDVVLAAHPEAVFLLGGDHGSRSYTDAHGPGDMIREVHSIFSAYRFPSVARRRLYPSISPVNGFRLLFDALFGTGLGLLPDRSFTSPRNHPERRRRVPDFGRLPFPPNPQPGPVSGPRSGDS